MFVRMIERTGVPVEGKKDLTRKRNSDPLHIRRK